MVFLTLRQQAAVAMRTALGTAHRANEAAYRESNVSYSPASVWA